MKPFPMTGILAGLLLVATITASAAPQEEPKKQDPSTPRGLEVCLIANKATYTNLQDKTQLDKSRTGGYPAAPEVDLAFELKNTTKQELHFRIDGDDQSLQLSLKGPGAVSVAAINLFTEELRGGDIKKVAPGKTYTIVIKRLSYGYRGVAQRAYWTATGAYTLTASFTTEVGWRNDDEEVVKLRPCTLKTEAIQLTVKEPGKQ
jgi:hypothetical protein